MDETAQGPRCCEVCGDPIGLGNELGICNDRSKIECRRARGRAEQRRRRLRLNPGLATPRHCEVCGDPLRSDNKSGICGKPDRPECRKVRDHREWEARPHSEPEHCEICGVPLRADNVLGICERKDSPECMLARWRKMRDATPESEILHCRICGGLLRIDNIIGICQRTPACIEARTQRHGAKSKPRQCSHPDGCPNPSRLYGLCEMHAMRLVETGELGPAEPEPTPVAVHAGDRFGKWVALEDYDRIDGTIRCHCDCGNEKRIYVRLLVAGESTSCNCGHHSRRSRPDPIVQPDDVYNMLTVLEAGHYYADLVRCRCECGAVTSKRAGMVKAGKVKSCKCQRYAARRTHGLSRHPFYGIWRGIVGRTTNPGNPAFKNYGAIGRTLCERWQGLPDGLLNFIEDMGPRPGREFSVERMDNSRGYSPDNCRWGTKSEQAMNQRKVGPLTQENRALTVQVGVLTTQIQQVVTVSHAPRKPARVAPLQDALF